MENDLGRNFLENKESQYMNFEAFEADIDTGLTEYFAPVVFVNQNLHLMQGTPIFFPQERMFKVIAFD